MGYTTTDVTSYLVTVSGEHQIGGIDYAYTIEDNGGVGKIVFASAPPDTTKIEVLAIAVGAADIGVNLLAGLFEQVNNQGGTAIPSSLNYNVAEQQIMYYPAEATADYVVNVRASDSMPLSSYLAEGKAITLVLMVAQGTTPYNMTDIQIDGTTVWPIKWAGGTEPAASASSIQAYTITIVRTGASAYAVFGSATKFA